MKYPIQNSPPLATRRFVRCALVKRAKGLLAAALLLVTVNGYAGIPVETWTHANGARVYLVNSPGIPMVDVRVDLDAGSRRDPPGKTGLASVTAGLMTQGVLASSNGPALNENALGEEIGRAHV